MKFGQYHYYVEGENERVLVEILSKCKDEKFNVIRPGKIDVFNVVEREIKSTHMNTVVVLVFDTDTKNRAILDKNTKFLEKHKKIKEVILIPQVYNLEDELIRSCNIKNILQLLGSKSKREFKSDFNKVNNLNEYLIKAEFAFDKLWRKNTDGIFAGITSGISKIEK
ncbi:hypothetical protein [Lachnoanaerobaculum saburreum]|uniref:Uncharacterized protein n=1 Tax=Lachnoanaerobaculum saburreum TaxID=467210 RepID=A0A133ZNF4_9FIRM|nr:hypothetical protein HMPREF1866_01639 [Lachnoanaerobaculum saburreum]